MEDREDALDFIYKGWREGRQNRRNVVRQRGLDRTRSMLGPIMAQRARGSTASMPPSYPVLMPEYGTQTPTDSPSVENVEETVSMPPKPVQPTEEQTALAGSGRMDELRETMAVPDETVQPPEETMSVLENDFSNDITKPNDHPDDFITRINNDEERRQWIEEGQVSDQTPSINENAKEMVNQHVKDKFNEKLDRLNQRAGERASDETLSQDQRDEATLRQQLIEGMQSGMSDEELRAMAREGVQPMTQEDLANVESSKVPTLIAHNPETGDTLQISSDPLPTEEEFEKDYPGYVIGKHPEHEKAFEEAYGKMKEEATKTEKIPSPPKATEKGKKNLENRSKTLAEYGMGFKENQPEE